MCVDVEGTVVEISGTVMEIGAEVVENGAEVEFSIVRSIELWIGEALIP